MARGGQRCHCFSRNASFMRTVFCEYTLCFCAFFCDFLLLLLLLSPFFGIVSLGGSERRKWPAECTLEQAFLAQPSPRALRFRQPGLSFIFYSILECGRVWRMFCTPRRRAATGRLSCPRAGCRSGDAACLDLDLRLRDAAVRRDQFTACLATYRWWWCEVVRSGSAFARV